MKKMLILFLISLNTLTGCAGTNSQFDCPMKPGVRCASIDQVNAQIDNEEIGHKTLMPSNQMDIQTLGPKVKWNEQFTYSDPSNRKPLRYGETVQRIWIAPFEDISGNYHQESIVYTITKPGHWIGYPIKSSELDT